MFRFFFTLTPYSLPCKYPSNIIYYIGESLFSKFIQTFAKTHIYVYIVNLHAEVGQNILNGQKNMLTRRTCDFNVTCHLEIPFVLLSTKFGFWKKQNRPKRLFSWQKYGTSDDFFKHPNSLYSSDIGMLRRCIALKSHVQRFNIFFWPFNIFCPTSPCKSAM